jgi:dihydroorotate dehydrogenase (fumarate)
MVYRLDQAGANGFVLFNRFYQPDIDLDTLEVKPKVLLSTPHAMRLPLRWIAILAGRTKADLVGSSGIHTGYDAIKMLMVGANATMLCSVLLKYGIDRIAIIEQEMRQWMEEHEYESVRQLRGCMSQIHCPDPSTFERAQYMCAITTYRPALRTEVRKQESGIRMGHAQACLVLFASRVTPCSSRNSHMNSFSVWPSGGYLVLRGITTALDSSGEELVVNFE